MGWFILVLFEVLERERKGMKSAENNQAENRRYFPNTSLAFLPLSNWERG